MKKITLILFVLIIFCTALLPCYAQETLPLVIDRADLLTDGEEGALAAKLETMCDRLDCDVVVLTEESIDTDAQSYADDYFDYNGYGRGTARDGILLLVSMEPRYWHVSGSGICNSRYVSTPQLEYISENIADDLQDGDYAGCFDTFAKRCDKIITAARSGKVYKEPFNFVMSLVISLVVGFIVAFIVTGVMKGKLKSVAAKREANSYLKPGSLNVTEARDMFLYRQIAVTPKPTENKSSGSHTSSSGRSHSGVGGKF